MSGAELKATLVVEIQTKLQLLIDQIQKEENPINRLWGTLCLSNFSLLTNNLSKKPTFEGEKPTFEGIEWVDPVTQEKNSYIAREITFKTLSSRYIAAEFPRKDRKSFYALCTMKKVDLIVELTSGQDRNHPDMVDCDPHYYPLSEKDVVIIGKTTISYDSKVKKRIAHVLDYIEERPLLVQNEGSTPSSLLHLHFEWKDASGTDPEKLLRFCLQLLPLLEDDSITLLAHCVAGKGRTGTFITTLELIKLLQQARDVLPDSTVYSIIEFLIQQGRKQRDSTDYVQVKEQLGTIIKVYELWKTNHGEKISKVVTNKNVVDVLWNALKIFNLCLPQLPSLQWVDPITQDKTSYCAHKITFNTTLSSYIAASFPITDEEREEFFSMCRTFKVAFIINLTSTDDGYRSDLEDSSLEYYPSTHYEVITLVKTTISYDSKVKKRISSVLDWVEEHPLIIQNEGSDSQPHALLHLHYEWEDCSGTDPEKLLQFCLQLLPLISDENATLLVHCFAGKGRSGTFITVLELLKRLERAKEPMSDDAVYDLIEQLIRNGRKHRGPHYVQVKKQLETIINVYKIWKQRRV